MGYDLRSLEKDTSISSNNGFWVNVLDLAQQYGWNPEGTIDGGKFRAFRTPIPGDSGQRLYSPFHFLLI